MDKLPARKESGGQCPVFDLAHEIRNLRNESSWHGSHNSRTLVKYPEVRVVLTVIEAGGAIPEHRSAGRIAIETVQGHVRMRAGGRQFDLPAGRMVVLDGAIPHAIAAIEDSAFLLTITWPVGSVVEAGAALVHASG